MRRNETKALFSLTKLFNTYTILHFCYEILQNKFPEEYQRVRSVRMINIHILVWNWICYTPAARLLEMVRVRHPCYCCCAPTKCKYFPDAPALINIAPLGIQRGSRNCIRGWNSRFYFNREGCATTAAAIYKRTLFRKALFYFVRPSVMNIHSGT